MQRAMTVVEWLMLLALSLLWGGSFLFNGILVQTWPPLTIVTARVLLAALALWAFIRLSGLAIPRGGKVWLAFFGMGLLNNVIPFTLIVWGQTQIASGLAAILNATTPLFGVLLAHVLTKDETLTVNRLAGVVIGITGVVWMIGLTVLAPSPSGPAFVDLGGGSLWGELATLAAALSYAFAGIFGRRFRSMGLAPIMPAAGQVTASALLLVPVTLLVDRPWTLAPGGLETWSALLGLALFSTALAYILFFRILATAGATNLMLVTILIPPSAILLGALVLGEQLALRHLVGLLLIGIGLAAIDGRLWRRIIMRSRPVQ
ncbi:DMT family transporter [Rhizobium sp. SSA_523]|uniref:DMT family transporter n=1 Tax=Rhizobium sp. SSA_523 TaxID=2952477 RepID=UPI0020901973|nr:DMT family transporter [Rhizobium sp. SSA_523]MCO5732668.1 DMT family transporter [Rhizobium sp. SSA_523]WKC23704.1 DMT family transporter [Rhizobium sp. SSA_523]